MTDWIVEAVLQFVRSPMWTTPVQNFIDSNCVYFDNEEELKLEYTAIHQKFRTLIEDVLESFLSELGTDAETMIKACEENKESDPKVGRFLHYLLALDDFRSFRKMMVKRNVELEAEAMEAWARMQAQHAADSLEDPAAKAAAASGPPPPPPVESQPPLPKPEPIAGDADAEKELQLALAASLTASEMIMKQAELEDAELQQALALSLAEEEERIRREERKREEARAAFEEAERQKQAQLAAEEKAKQEAILAEKMKQEKARHDAEIAVVKDESEIKKKAMEAEALEQRVRKLEIAKAEAVKNEDVHAAALPPKPRPEPENAPAQVIHVSLTDTKSDLANRPPEKSLGDLKHRSGTFGKFSALPSLAQPSFNELNRQLSTSDNEQKQAELQLKSKEERLAEEARAKAEIEARAKYMKEQRDKLIAQKAKERGEAMKQYAEEKGIGSPSGETTTTAPPAATAAATGKVDEEHKQMTRALLRRFKDDIVRESTLQ